MREAASKQVITISSDGSPDGQRRTEESCLPWIRRVLEDFWVKEMPELSFKRGDGGEGERV